LQEIKFKMVIQSTSLKAVTVMASLDMDKNPPNMILIELYRFQRASASIYSFKGYLAVLSIRSSFQKVENCFQLVATRRANWV